MNASSTGGMHIGTGASGNGVGKICHLGCPAEGAGSMESEGIARSESKGSTGCGRAAGVGTSRTIDRTSRERYLSKSSRLAGPHGSDAG
jgi:hypothetical protein